MKAVNLKEEPWIRWVVDRKDMQSTEGVFNSRYSFFFFFLAVDRFPSPPFISLHDYKFEMLHKTLHLKWDYKAEVSLLDFAV